MMDRLGLTRCCAFIAAIALCSCAAPRATLQRGSPLKATPEPSETVPAAPATTASRQGSPTPDGQCTEDTGALVDDSYRLPDQTGTAVFRAYLPPCYDRDRRSYPLAVFLHGYPQDEDHWIELGAVETYESLLNAGQIDPMVLIFARQPEPYFTQSDGGTGSLEDVLLNGLLPVLESKFRIEPRAARRALLGISRGGVWALEIALRHPEEFNILIALSPALAYNHPRRAYDPFEIASSSTEVPKHILITAGDSEPQFAVEIDRFTHVLNRSQIDFTYLKHAGRHEDAAWRSIMQPVFRFLAEAL
jgi:enterochelin esterase-like enzyme